MLQDAVEVSPVGVGDKNLSEIIASHQLHNLFHAPGIQLVENIVEQQERGRLAVGTPEEIKLS